MALSIQQVPSPHHKPRPGGITHISMHWMAGRIAGADAHFRANPQGRIAAPNGSSAHYGIAGTTIHQYVPESRRAGSDGNSASNDTTISIEHEGGWVQNGAYVKPSPQTHETSAQLCADIARRYGWKSLRVGGNVFPHNHYVNTMCPGTLDIHSIVNRANQILSGAAAPVEPEQEKDDDMKMIKAGGIDYLIGPGYIFSSPNDRFTSRLNALYGPSQDLGADWDNEKNVVCWAHSIPNGVWGQLKGDGSYGMAWSAARGSAVYAPAAAGYTAPSPAATVDTAALATAVVAGLAGKLGAGADTAALANAVEAILADNFAALPAEIRNAIIK